MDLAETTDTIIYKLLDNDHEKVIKVCGLSKHIDTRIARLLDYLDSRNKLTTRDLQELHDLYNQFYEYLDNRTYFVRGSGFLTLQIQPEKMQEKFNELKRKF